MARSGRGSPMRGVERPRREERGGRPVSPWRRIGGSWKHRFSASHIIIHQLLLAQPRMIYLICPPLSPPPLHLFSFLYLKLSFREASIELKSQSQIGLFCQGDVLKSKMTNAVYLLTTGRLLANLGDTSSFAAAVLRPCRETLGLTFSQLAMTIS